MNPYIESLGFTDIMSDSEEKTPTVSPDQGVTGEKVLFSQTLAEKVFVKPEKLINGMKWDEMSNDQHRKFLMDSYNAFCKDVFQKTIGIKESMKESTKKRQIEWFQFKKSSEQFESFMGRMKDLLCSKVELEGLEDSEDVAQMAELWTQVLDEVQAQYQLWSQHFEVLREKNKD